MEVVLYAIIFIIGALFGSFFTLAVYRIPRLENITTKHSYCPNCSNKLKFFDLIPILSYVFLRGKCRYCKKPIRARYFILEILSGSVFLLFALSLKFNFYRLEELKLVYFIFTLLYFASLFIIAGIDKEKNTIQKSVLLYGVIVATMYILYLYILQGFNIYRYVIYLFMLLILLLIDTTLLKKKAMSNYTIQILILCVYISMFTDEVIFLLTAGLTLLTIGFKLILKKIVKRKNKTIKEDYKISEKLPIAFLLSVSNIIVVILSNFILN